MSASSIALAGSLPSETSLGVDLSLDDGATWSEIATALGTFDVQFPEGDSRNILLRYRMGTNDIGVLPSIFSPVMLHIAGMTVWQPSETTVRAYHRLPEAYALLDGEQGDYDLMTDRPQLRYLSLITDQMGEFAALIDDPSMLTDPTKAKSAWLPWLSQLLSVSLDPSLTDEEKREALTSASSRWRSATKTAVADAARSELIGSKFVRVYDHSKAGQPIGTASEWDLLVVTRNTETPDPTKVLTAIERRGAKPVGTRLEHSLYEVTWDILEANHPTWDSIDQVGTWDELESTGL